MIDRLYVCDLTGVDRLKHKTTSTHYDIPRGMRRLFFLEALKDEA